MDKISISEGFSRWMKYLYPRKKRLLSLSLSLSLPTRGRRRRRGGRTSGGQGAHGVIRREVLLFITVEGHLESHSAPLSYSYIFCLIGCKILFFISLSGNQDQEKVFLRHNGNNLFKFLIKIVRCYLGTSHLAVRRTAGRRRLEPFARAAMPGAGTSGEF